MTKDGKDTGKDILDSYSKQKRAVIADAFGLLIDGNARTSKYFYEFFQDGVDMPKEDLVKLYRKYRDRSFTEADYHYEDALRDVFDELGMMEYFDGFLKENNAAIHTVYAKEGVIETLKALKQKGIPVYVLTDFDGPKSRAISMLKTAGVNELVAGVVSSKDVGHMKPSPEAFEYVLEKYGLDKERTAFIGHSHDELRGAYDLGFETYACFFEDEDGDFSFLKENNRLGRLEDLIEKC